MKLIYHHRTLAKDAQGIHIQNIVQAFRELGHDVVITALVSSPSEAPSMFLAPTAGFYSLVKASPQWVYELSALLYNFVGLQRLERAIRKYKPHFVYERYSLNTLCGVIAARFHRIPVVLEVNSPLTDEQESQGKLFFKRLSRFLERWVLSRATHVIVVTEVLKKLLEAKGIPSTKLTVMHNGVDPRRFNPAISGDRIRAKYGMANDTVVGFAGWFRKWHGLEMLIEAVAAEPLRKQTKLLLVGDGPALEDLQRIVVAKDIKDMVYFSGPIEREEMAEYIAAMDIAVQPSATEYACPMKIIEYMAMARCIVAPQQPNIMEILDSSSALLFDPGDVSSLRKAIGRAASDPQLRQELGTTAYQILNKRGYYWIRNAETVIALISAPPPNVSPGQEASG